MSGEDSRVAGKDWYEVIGMVKDFGWQLPEQQERSAMYRPRLRLPMPGAESSEEKHGNGGIGSN